MRCVYRTDEQEYIVFLANDILPEDGKVEVAFIARVNGGKGRLPKPKQVPVENLSRLVAFEESKS